MKCIEKKEMVMKMVSRIRKVVVAKAIGADVSIKKMVAMQGLTLFPFLFMSFYY